jgi:predicted DNA binding protein
MSNEELILQGIQDIKQQGVEHNKILVEHGKILVEHSKILVEHSKILVEQGKAIAQLQKSTDIIATAVAEQQIDMGEVKEKVTKIEKDVEIIKNVQDDMVGKYDLLNQERVVMSADVKDHEERIVKLEQGGVVMGVKMAV